MIKLLEIEAENFRSWEHLSLTGLDKKGLCLIQGENGAGKSNIRMIIEYLIIDKTSESIPVDDLTKDQNTACKLYGKFEKDGQIIEITKYRNHKTNGNKITVSCDGDKSLTTTDRRETQKNIIKLFDVSSEELFASTIFTAKSKSFVESTETDRKKLLYEVLPLEKYNSAFLKAQLRISKIEKELITITNDIKSKQDMLRSKIDYLERLKTKKDSFRDEIESEMLYLSDQMEELVPKSLTSSMNAIEILKESISDEAVDITKVYDTVEQLKKEEDRLMSDKRYLELKLNDVSGESVCPILERACTDLRENQDRAIKLITPDLRSINKELKDISKKLLLNYEIIEENETTINNNKRVREDILAVERRIERIDLFNESINEKREDLNDRINELNEKENPFTELIEEEKKEISKCRSEIRELMELNSNLADDLLYYRFWETGFSKHGIPNMKAEEFLESIEDETNRYLSSISDKMFVSIEGQTTLKSNKSVREKISYSVCHPDKAITHYFSFSSGERQRVKIADLFAFHQLISKFNFMFLDEVLEGSLDSKGKANVIKLLKNKATEIDSLFVISHDVEIKDAFDHIINIKSENGVSKNEI